MSHKQHIQIYEVLTGSFYYELATLIFITATHRDKDGNNHISADL